MSNTHQQWMLHEQPVAYARLEQLALNAIMPMQQCAAVILQLLSFSYNKTMGIFEMYQMTTKSLTSFCIEASVMSNSDTHMPHSSCFPIKST